MNPFKKGDVVEVVESWDTDIINDGEVYTVVEDNKYWVRIECPTIAYGYIGGWEPSRFELVQAAPPKQESPKPSSFKDFLSPMCRVEMRNGDVAIFIEDSFVGDGSVVGLVSQYLDDGKVAPPSNVELNKELEIVRVLEKPPYLANIFFEDHFGNVLWASPEIVAKRKEKAEKIAFKQIEINMAQRKLNELVKQLKEIE